MKSQQTVQKSSQIKDQLIPQSKKYSNQKSDKQNSISYNLIAQTSLDNSMTNSLSQQQKISLALQLRSIHLQWLNIKKIQNLQVFQKLNVLYLQNNKIRRIENLECLGRLEYLALNDNMISKVENIKCLTKLQGLNLNNNQIEDLDTKELPNSLQLLSFKNNPITFDANYKKDIIKGLRSLEVLDDIVITPQQKLKSIGAFPSQLLQYSSQMNQFRRKKLVQKSIGQQNKPILLGGGIINQKIAQTQIREKTIKYLNQNKQTFKTQMKDQIQNFQQKIIVSKNIRQIKTQEEKDRRDRLEAIREQKLLEIQREITEIKRAVKGQIGAGSRKFQKFSQIRQKLDQHD